MKKRRQHDPKPNLLKTFWQDLYDEGAVPERWKYTELQTRDADTLFSR